MRSGTRQRHGPWRFRPAAGRRRRHRPTPLEVTANDADEILAIMDMVLDEVSQRPAKVRKLREARKTKKQTGL